MTGISSKAAGTLENRKKYNGIDFDSDLDINTYEAFYRNLDPQTGRWWQIDPKIENMEMLSPYVSNYDNPVTYKDELGDEPDNDYPIITITKEKIGTVQQRIIGISGLSNGTSLTTTVDVYKAVVTDTEDRNFRLEFGVTRDAMMVDKVEDVSTENRIKLTNVAFEPPNASNNTYQAVARPDFPDGTGNEALKLRQNGSEVMKAAPSDASARWKFRDKADQAKGVMMHVGGNYDKNGKPTVAASEGCFGICNKGNSLNNPSNKFSNSVIKTVLNQSNKSKTAKGRIDVKIEKRNSNEIPNNLHINKKGQQVQ